MWRVVFFSLAMLSMLGCNQNTLDVRNGPILEANPKPAADPSAKPLAGAISPVGMSDGEGEEKVPPFVKAYFMHMFVEALYSKPGNQRPNPTWQSPLKDPENGRVWCTDCHVDPTVDFTKIPKRRTPQNEELEKNHDFMVGLMTKWVARLNSDQFKAKAKLKQPVTCLTCHATDPRN